MDSGICRETPGERSIVTWSGNECEVQHEKSDISLSILSEAKYEIQYVREKWDFSLLSVILSRFYKWSYFKKNGKTLLHFGLFHYLRDWEKKDKYGSYRLQGS